MTRRPVADHAEPATNRRVPGVASFFDGERRGSVRWALVCGMERRWAAGKLLAGGREGPGSRSLSMQARAPLRSDEEVLAR